MLPGRVSHDQDSVATAASVVREAIVLVSVHEERANVGRSIQVESAEASSLPLFSTNLSDKGHSQPGCHARMGATKAHYKLTKPVV